MSAIEKMDALLSDLEVQMNIMRSSNAAHASAHAGGPAQTAVKTLQQDSDTLHYKPNMPTTPVTLPTPINSPSRSSHSTLPIYQTSSASPTTLAYLSYAISHSGPLLKLTTSKQTGQQSWRPYHFALIGNHLFAFKSPEPKEAVALAFELAPNQNTKLGDEENRHSIMGGSGGALPKISLDFDDTARDAEGGDACIIQIKASFPPPPAPAPLRDSKDGVASPTGLLASSSTGLPSSSPLMSSSSSFPTKSLKRVWTLWSNNRAEGRAWYEKLVAVVNYQPQQHHHHQHQISEPVIIRTPSSSSSVSAVNVSTNPNIHIYMTAVDTLPASSFHPFNDTASNIGITTSDNLNERSPSSGPPSVVDSTLFSYPNNGPTLHAAPVRTSSITKNPHLQPKPVLSSQPSASSTTIPITATINPISIHREMDLRVHIPNKSQTSSTRTLNVSNGTSSTSPLPPATSSYTSPTLSPASSPQPIPPQYFYLPLPPPPSGASASAAVSTPGTFTSLNGSFPRSASHNSVLSHTTNNSRNSSNGGIVPQSYAEFNNLVIKMNRDRGSSGTTGTNGTTGSSFSNSMSSSVTSAASNGYANTSYFSPAPYHQQQQQMYYNQSQSPLPPHNSTNPSHNSWNSNASLGSNNNSQHNTNNNTMLMVQVPSPPSLASMQRAETISSSTPSLHFRRNSGSGVGVGVSGRRFSRDHQHPFQYQSQSYHMHHHQQFLYPPSRTSTEGAGRVSLEVSNVGTPIRGRPTSSSTSATAFSSSSGASPRRSTSSTRTSGNENVNLNKEGGVKVASDSALYPALNEKDNIFAKMAKEQHKLERKNSKKKGDGGEGRSWSASSTSSGSGRKKGVVYV
jgi:hypothetical protein